MDIWQETGSVRFSDIDRSDRITLSALFSYFQEAAINHAKELGAGRDVLESYKQAWILSRFSLVMDRRLYYDQAFVIRTWPRGTDKLFAVRDFDMRSLEGEVLVRAKSAWLIIDTEKRRIVRPQAITGKMPLNEGIDSLNEPARALEDNSRLQSFGSRTALYSDIDYNGHVNNVRYIQWIADISEPCILESASSLRFDINYVNELKIGESAALFIGDSEGGLLAYEGRHENKTTFRAQLTIL